MLSYLEGWKAWCDGYDPEKTEFKKLLELCTGKDVLEVGCGDGRVAKMIYPYCKSVYGVDPDEKLIADAKEYDLEQNVPLNLKFAIGGAEKLDFPDDSFDVVLSPWVLHLVPDKHLACSEAKRVLRPGGVHFVSAPLPGSGYDNIARLFVGHVPEDEIDAKTYYEEPLKAAFGSFQKIGPEAIPIVFPGLGAAVRSMRWALKEWLDRDLYDHDEVVRLTKAMEKYFNGEDKVTLHLNGCYYKAVK